MQVFSFYSGAKRPTKLVLGTAIIALLAGCEGSGFDFDLRDMGNGFDTTDALDDVPNRPRPDSRGIISYPGYQVVVAERDDTVTAIAARLGLNAAELAAYNGIEPNAVLRRDEVIALPARVAEPSPATGALTTGPILPAPVVTTTPLETVAPTPATQTGQEPVRHHVAVGETVYSISRLYAVPVEAIAEWNGLGADLSIRSGQFLMIPQANSAAPIAAPTPTVAPGAGSETPVPPSAATALPDETPEPVATAAPPVVAPNLGAQQTELTGNADATLIYPVQGTIIRAYAAGRNDGIDIASDAQTPVKAAAAGVVAAITTNTDGIQIVVIRHSDNLLTVYTHLEALTVTRDDTVSQGQVIGQVLAGNPSYLHFEVRRGMDSADPADFLP